MGSPHFISSISSGIAGGLNRIAAKLEVGRQQNKDVDVSPPFPLASFGEQGTKVGGAGMGHMDPQGYGLYHPWQQIEFSTDSSRLINNPAERFTTIPWPENPSITEEAVNGNRGYIQREMDQGLQQGEAPGRIIRYLPMRIFGAIAASTGGPLIGDQDGGSLAWKDGWTYIPHFKTIRQALGTKGPQKLSDDNAPIPAIFAGNPRP